MNLLKPILELSNSLILILIGIIGIGFIIGFHELGHFLFGKLFKIKTPAFAVGFGPKIYKKNIGETNFSIGIIPLGGYVESDKESFESKPYWQKLCVLAGGITFNLIFAYIVFCLLFALGLPKTSILYPLNTNPIISIKEDPSTQYNKEKLKLEINDKIIAVNGKSINNKPINFFSEIENIALDAIKNAPKNETGIKPEITGNVVITIERNNQIQDLTIEIKPLLEAISPKKMQIYFQFAEPKGLPILDSITNGVNLTNKYIKMSLYMFKNMITKRDTSALGGPIAIISETAKSVNQGFKIFLLLLAMISVSLAIINLIPLPILDGGQALIYTIEAIIRKKFTEKTKEFIFLISWAFMLVLFVLISTRDVWNIIKVYFIKK